MINRNSAKIKDQRMQKRAKKRQGIFISRKNWLTKSAEDTHDVRIMVEPEEYEPEMMKQYLDFLRKDAEKNPSKLVRPDMAQEKKLDELLAGVE